MATINKIDTVLLTAISNIMGVAKAGIKKFNQQFLTAPSYVDFYSVPTATVSISANWNSSTGGSVTTDLINETSEDPGENPFDYAFTSNSSNGANWTFSISAPTDTPDSNSPHVLVWNAAHVRDGNPNLAGTTTSITIELLQGGTSIASFTQETQKIGTYFRHSETLSEGQIASITSYSDLSIRVTSSGGGGSPNNRRGISISYVYLTYKIGTPPTYVNYWNATPFSASYLTNLYDYLAANTQTQIETASRFGSYGTSGWNYGTIMAHPNGNMYCVPYFASQFLRINPQDDTTTIFGTSYAGNNKWHGAVLTNDSTIYCNPRDWTSFLKLSSTETQSTFGNLNGTGKSAACALAQNEKIYAPPWDASYITVADTTNDTITSFGSLGTGVNKFASAVLSPWGFVYCAPRSLTYVMKIDPSDNSFTTIGSFTTAAKYNIGVYHANGKMYFSPSQANNILVVDTADDSISTISCNTGYNQVELGLNGFIYFTAGNSFLDAIRLDPTDDSISYVSALNIRTAATKTSHTGVVYGSPGTDGGITKFLSAASVVDDKLFMRGNN